LYNCWEKVGDGREKKINSKIEKYNNRKIEK